MRKMKTKKNSKHYNNSYKYITIFCILFAISNFFVEKLANKNEGKNNSQIQNVRFNQAQSYALVKKINKISAKDISNNFKNLSVKEKKQRFIAELFPIIHMQNHQYPKGVPKVWRLYMAIVTIFQFFLHLCIILDLLHPMNALPCLQEYPPNYLLLYK